MAHKEHKIGVRRKDKLAVIEIQGDLTASAEKDMDSAYKEACGYNVENVLIKFDGISRINSAGIASVINLVIESQEREHRIFITGVSKHFRKIFELVGLTRYTTIVDSEDEVK